MKVKEESEETGLKLSIQKTKIIASGSISLWQRDGNTMETVTDFIFLGSQITADSGAQFITPAGPRQSLLLAKNTNQHL